MRTNEPSCHCGQCGQCRHVTYGDGSELVDHANGYTEVRAPLMQRLFGSREERSWAAEEDANQRFKSQGHTPGHC